MPDIHVPWPRRSRPPLRGVGAVIATVATSAYRIVGPLISRGPSLVLIGACIGACLTAWGAALLVRSVWDVQTALECGGVVARGQWMTLAEARQGCELTGVAVPAVVVWLLQSNLLRDLIGLAGIIGFVSVLAAFSIWWERKVSAFIQSRLGPMRVGGWHGWAQTIADGIKLVGKEDIVPAQADGPLFRLAPYLAMAPVVAAFAALPFGASWVLREIDVALLLILALLGIDILGVLLAGWASNNKWSMYGAMREACQVVSYEIPMGLALLIPVMIAGSLSLQDIAARQAGGWANWLAWHSPWSFMAMFVYFISSLAACKRAPFDLPEAESELVAGFHTEYSGFRWSVFFFGEYAAMFIVSGILVILFLGGWDAPWAGLAPAAWAESTAPMIQLASGVLFSGPLWFVFKCMLLVTAQMWIRWTLPRLRIDQVLYSCVQVMLPLALLLVLLSAVWELLSRSSDVAAGIALVLRYGLASIGALMTISMIVIAAAGMRHRRGLVGSMAVDRPLRGA